MAANIEQPVKIDVDDISNGHNIHFSFPVQSIIFTETTPLHVDYDVECSGLPTSWKVGISYKQILETGQVSCFVTLTRTDLTNTSVEATVRVSVLDDEKKSFVRFPVTICSSQMLSNEMIQGTFEDSREPGAFKYMVSLDLVLRVSVLVRSCHLTENFDRQKYFPPTVKEHCGEL